MSSLFSHWSDSALSVFNTHDFDDPNTSLNLFQMMFSRLPRESENIGEMNRAGSVILMMVDSEEAPTKLTKHECKLLLEAVTAMTEPYNTKITELSAFDKRILDDISTVMVQIQNSNPQCAEIWRAYSNK